MHLTRALLVATQTAIAISRSGSLAFSSIPVSPRPSNLDCRGHLTRSLGRNDAALSRIVGPSPVGGRGIGTRMHKTSLGASAVVMGVEEDDVSRPAAGRILVTKPVMNRSLAFLAGVADIMCFRRHECYANMMTGNTLKLAASVAEFRPVDAAFYAAVLTSYIFGFGAYRAADRLVERRRDSYDRSEAGEHVPSPTPLVVAPAIVALFALYDALCVGSAAAGAKAATRWFVPVLAVGSAAVNAAGAESTGAVTCMMTGNLQKIANYASDSVLRLFLGGPRVRDERRSGALGSAGVVLSFVAGVAAATAAFRLDGGGLAESNVFSGGTAMAAVVGAVGRKPFTVLGGVYAFLLVAFDRSMRFKSPWQVLKQISWGMREDAAEPCQLDKLEAECIVPESEDDAPEAL